MTNTTRYFDAYKQHRAWVSGAVDKFNRECERLKRYKGSKGYDEEMGKAREERDKTIADAVAATARAFDEVLADMSDKVTSAPLDPPSTDALNLVTALRMREKLSLNELERAAEQVGDNDVCLSLVMELAKKHGHVLTGRKYGSATHKAREAVEELGRAAKATLAWRGETRAQIVRNHVANRDYKLSAVGMADVEPTTPKETLSVLGSIDHADYDAVTAIIN